MEVRFRPTTTLARSGAWRLLPNINASGRPLPPEVSADDIARNLQTDRERPSRKLKDREIYSFEVMLTESEWTTTTAPMLDIHFTDGLFGVLDQSGVPVAGWLKSPVRINLKQARARNTKHEIQFFLEAQSYWGLTAASRSTPRQITFRLVDGDQLKAEQAGIAGRVVTTADVILLGDDAPAERLFVCDVDDNGPSLVEVGEAAKLAGVPITVVPVTVNRGDSWLQDQFQLGWSVAGGESQRVVVHLPRMVNDSALVPGTPNLRNFTDGHFPSDAIGVAKDFWADEVSLSDGTVNFSLGVAESFVLYKHLGRVVLLLGHVFSVMRKARKDANPRLEGGDTSDLYRVRLAIDDNLKLLAGYGSADDEILTAIRVLNSRIAEVSSFFAAGPDRTVRLTVQVKAGEGGGSEARTLEFNAQNKEVLQRFWRKLRALHSSGNYGGNIEVSPSFGDVAYGRILTGSVDHPPLVGFLKSRGPRQPHSAVYTRWLHVAHIDEVMAFAPGAGGSFSILRADPMLALGVLEQAVRMQKAGTLVTRLFRGKKWIHESAGGLSDPKYPPQAYRMLVGTQSPYDRSGLGKKEPETRSKPYGDSAFYDDRRFLVASARTVVSARYAAFMTCADLLTACGTTNRAIDALYLSNKLRSPEDFLSSHYYGDLEEYRREALPFRLDTVLQQDFRGVPVHSLPVLFDRMGDYVGDGTQAVIPGAVNLQTLNRHVLVPRPYGPRMRPADAIALLRALSVAGYKLPPLPDIGWIQARGLDRTWHWTRASEAVFVAQLAKWPSKFDPEYDEMRLSIGLVGALSTASWDTQSTYHLVHAKDKLANHPNEEPETLYWIATYFKDGFDEFKNWPVDYCKGDTADAHPRQDKYEAEIRKVMDRVRQANPGAFGPNGEVLSKTWTRIAIPENTVDVFELYIQLVLESLGLTVHWVDSWYYHVHSGGIHCGTNVLRSRPG